MNWLIAQWTRQWKTGDLRGTSSDVLCKISFTGCYYPCCFVVSQGPPSDTVPTYVLCHMEHLFLSKALAFSDKHCMHLQGGGPSGMVCMGWELSACSCSPSCHTFLCIISVTSEEGCRGRRLPLLAGPLALKGCTGNRAAGVITGVAFLITASSC